MNKSDLLDKIKSLLNRMRDHETPDDVTSKEELGPLLKDAEELLETVSVLKFLIEQEVDQPQEPETIEEIPAELDVDEPLAIEEVPVEVVEEAVEAEVVVEPITIGSTVSYEPSEEPSETIVQDEAPPSAEPENQTTINDLGTPEQEQVRLADKLETEAVANLQSAIGLNERFLFINELFDGNEEAYKNAIAHLNDLSHLEEAMQYVRAEISDKFNWDQEQESTISFYSLIERRYAN